MFTASLTLAAAAPAAPPAWHVLTEFAYYVILFAVSGGTLAHVLVVAPALRRAEPDGTGPAGDAVSRRAGLGLGVLGVMFVVALWLQLAGTTAGAVKNSTFGAALSPAAIARHLAEPAAAGWISPGALLALQNLLHLAAALALATLLAPRARTRGRVRTTATTATVLVLAATALPAAPVAPTPAAKVVSGILTQVHVLGSSTWVGGMVFLVALAFASRAATGIADVWATAWQRFSTLALVAVGLLLTSGLWLLWMHVGTPGQLLTTTYGRFLLVKLVLVLAMLVAGALNQLALLPRVARLRRATPADGSLLRLTLRHFPRLVAAEAVLGLAVLTIVPFLSGSARKQAGEAGSPAVDRSVLLVGVLFVAMLALSFVAAVRVGDRLGRRDPAALAGPAG